MADEVENLDQVLRDVAGDKLKAIPPPALQWTENIFENIMIAEMLLQNMPASAQHRAREASKRLEKGFIEIITEAGRDPAPPIGLVWCLHQLCARIIGETQQGSKIDTGTDIIKAIQGR